MIDVAKKLVEYRGWQFISLIGDVVNFKRTKEIDHTCNVEYSTLRRGGDCKTCSDNNRRVAKEEIPKLIKPNCGCTFVGRERWCPHYNHLVCFPDSAKEWNYKKNYPLRPETSSPKGKKICWWTCPNEWCNQIYDQTPKERSGNGTRKGSRCPFCAGKRVCEWNSLLSNYPELCLELDPLNDVKPDKVTPGTDVKLTWICARHPEGIFKWDVVPRHRINSHSGCPKCNQLGYNQRFGGHEEFVRLSHEIHQSRYSYPDSYMGNTTPINIHCSVLDPESKTAHGNFLKTPQAHKAGQGCPKCNDPKYAQMVGGHEYFVKKSKEVHGDIYQYNDRYAGDKTPLKIYCPIIVDGLAHGDFIKAPHDHKAGEGCPKCNDRRYAQMVGGHAEFVRQCNIIHSNKYSYPDEYVKCDIKIDIDCPVKDFEGKAHGLFPQTPNNHKNGHGCPKCDIGYEQKIGGHKVFVERSNSIHNGKYSYPEEYVNSDTKIKIYCPVYHTNTTRPHGIFRQRPADHVRGIGCHQCASQLKESKLSRLVQRFLEELGFVLNITCFNEQKFVGMVYERALRIDKFVPCIRFAIEPDGIQHFKESNRESLDKLRRTHARDITKDAYCVNNKISLLRVPHDWDFTIDILRKVMQLCYSGYHVYASYSHYMEIVKTISDMSNIYYIEIPSPYSTGKYPNPTINK
jgi:hypothetical protein